eukprot:COSAG02_NODE_119_length_35335_cov_12.823192_15_plen_112_part_00
MANQRVSSIEQSASEYLAGLAFEPDAYTRVCHGAPPHRRGVNTIAGASASNDGTTTRSATIDERASSDSGEETPGRPSIKGTGVSPVPTVDPEVSSGLHSLPGAKPSTRVR